jgi:hypothetical protein
VNNAQPAQAVGSKIKTMYNLYYWKWQPVLMYTFQHYTDATKALDVLNFKYPDAKIWIQPIQPVYSFEEWQAKYSVIPEYENK